jgi:drug/metabolite transporter (DMT)-like permease
VIFLLPACCDMTGTSLMYVGLNLTHASVFQMLRGSVILFTGIFSVVFLGRKLYAFHWIGMMLVLFGSKFIHIVFHHYLGTCLGFSCAHGFSG